GVVICGIGYGNLPIDAAIAGGQQLLPGGRRHARGTCLLTESEGSGATVDALPRPFETVDDRS
ncbi:MAG: hypothetical protein NTU91_10045, partial [Chloroflexi bacterium]|nr:hypothetical protein [Chloroflexota bacterium]